MGIEGYSRLTWEEIEHYEGTWGAGQTSAQRTYSLRRSKVPNGWLVQMVDVQFTEMTAPLNTYAHPAGAGVGGGITFVPDPGHSWTLADAVALPR